MGQSHSKTTVKVRKHVVKQKTETAHKTGVLSLTDHNLNTVPDKVYEIPNLKALDLSHNRIKHLPNKMNILTTIRTLNLSNNKLAKGTLIPLSKLDNLQSLTLSYNQLGVDVDGEKKLVGPPLPSLSSSLKMIKLDHNHLPSIPKSIYAPELTKLEKIDLSNNQINEIPKEFCENLSSSLTELNLDHNQIASLPRAIGLLVKLKSLSLESNKIVVLSTSFDQRNPQPLPEELFVSTPLIDLNLKGNRMTNGQLNEFEGFGAFLERRQKLKSKNIHGGALTDLGMCGLE